LLIFVNIFRDVSN